MDLLGKLFIIVTLSIGNNLAKVRKCLEENYNLKIAI